VPDPGAEGSVVPRARAGLVDRFRAWSNALGAGLDGDLERADTTARALTRGFYLLLLLIAVRHLLLWNYYVGLREIQPLWPVGWAAGDEGRAAAIVLVLFVLGSLVAAIVPHQRAARAAAFLGCFEFAAFVNSFGAIRHVHHLLVLTAFMFVFLPGNSGARARDDEDRRAYLRAFRGVQCAAMLTYSMSGVVKLATGLWHLVSGQGGFLSPSAMALHAANSALRFGVEPPLAGLAVRAGAFGLPVYLLVLGLEIGALPAAFRPRLHRLWGALLILMHVGIGLTLNLWFLPSIGVLAVLFLASPFARAARGRGSRSVP